MFLVQRLMTTLRGHAHLNSLKLNCDFLLSLLIDRVFDTFQVWRLLTRSLIVH